MSNNDISNISRKDKLKFVDLPENTSIKNISNECLDLLYISKLNKCNSQNINAPFDLLLNSIVLINNKIDKLCNTLDIDKENDIDCDINDLNNKTDILTQKNLLKLKRKTALDFINDLLVTIGHNKISDLKKFENIKRASILTDECKKVLDLHIDKLINVFTKSVLQFRNKKIVEHYIITVLRQIAIHCGFELISFQKFEKIGDKSVSQLFYSIK